MFCPHCHSTENRSVRKYEAQAGDTNRTKYRGMNVDRRRYKCNGCNRPFYTIELSETLFEQHYYDGNPVQETKARVR